MGRKLSALQHPELNLQQGRQMGSLTPSNQKPAGNSASPRGSRSNTANPPVGKIGFVSAVQIPTGGQQGGQVQPYRVISMAMARKTSSP